MKTTNNRVGKRSSSPTKIQKLLRRLGIKKKPFRYELSEDLQLLNDQVERYQKFEYDVLDLLKLEKGSTIASGSVYFAIHELIKEKNTLQECVDVYREMLSEITDSLKVEKPADIFQAIEELQNLKK